MLRNIVIGFALVLLTIIAVTQVISVYKTHFSNDTDDIDDIEPFVVFSKSILYDPSTNTSSDKCDLHGPEEICGHLSYFDNFGQVRSIFLDIARICFKESVIDEPLPPSCYD